MNVCASNCNCLCVWVKVFLKCVDMDSENNNMCTTWSVIKYRLLSVSTVAY